MTYFVLAYCILTAWMAGVLTVAGAIRNSGEYYVGAIAGLILSVYLGLCMIFHVVEQGL